LRNSGSSRVPLPPARTTAYIRAKVTGGHPFEPPTPEPRAAI